MNWVALIAFIYISYYTFCFAIIVWKEGKKAAAVVVIVLAFSIVSLAPFMLFIK